MQQFMAVVRGNGVVSEAEAKGVFQVLGPILEFAPDDEEAIDATRRVIERTPQSGMLAAVLDWWFVVTTGQPSTSGAAYRLPDELGNELIEAMTALLEVGGDFPAAQWARDQHDLPRRLAELDQRLKLDHYGKSKLPKEREVWAHFTDSVAPTTEALQEGRRAEAVDFDSKRFGLELKNSGIADGSRRWKEMHKRADAVISTWLQTIEVQSRVRPWAHVASATTIQAVPNGVRTLFDPISSLPAPPDPRPRGSNGHIAFPHGRATTGSRRGHRQRGPSVVGDDRRHGLPSRRLLFLFWCPYWRSSHLSSPSSRISRRRESTQTKLRSLDWITTWTSLSSEPTHSLAPRKTHAVPRRSIGKSVGFEQWSPTRTSKRPPN